MRRSWLVVLATALLILPVSGGDAAARSRAVPRAFQRLYPCPATGLRTGACPGWIRDHIVPLCAGGADAVENMQWQTREAAARKDRAEDAECRALRALR